MRQFLQPLAIALITILVSSTVFSQEHIWSMDVGGVDDAYAQGVAYDSDGNVYITGFFEGTADFDPGPGTAILNSVSQRAIFVAKYDSSRNYQWAFGITVFWGGGTTIEIGPAGNIFIGGSYTNSPDFDPGPGTAILSSSDGTFFAKYDSNGNFIWVKGLDGTAGISVRKLKLDDFGNIYIVGEFWGTADFDPNGGTVYITSAGINDVFFAKYDSSGNYIWAKSFGATGQDYAADIELDDSGNVILTGRFNYTVDFDPGPGVANQANVALQDIFIAKYDNNGNYIWAISMGGPDHDNSGGIVAIDGDIYITGWFEDSIDFDPGPGTAMLYAVAYHDLYVAKYDENGNYIWAFNVGWIQESGHDIGADCEGNIYITGKFNNTVDFDPGPGQANLTFAGWDDIVVAKYDTAGNYKWAINMGGVGSDNGTNIAVDCLGSVYVAGWLTDTGDYDGSPDTALLYGNGRALFLGRYSQTMTCSTISSFTQSATILCEGDTLEFTNSSTASTNYKWLINDSLFSTADSTSIAFDTVGNYSIKLVATYWLCHDTSEVSITVNPIDSLEDLDIAICPGDSVLIYGMFRSSVGTYYNSWVNGNGCDSVRSTSLSMLLITITSIPDENICAGDSILLFGNYQFAAGTYTDTLSGSNTCDSIITVNLLVLTDYNENVSFEICEGDSILLGGSYQNAQGIYYDSLSSQYGCDSNIIISLAVLSDYNVIDSMQICADDSVLLGGSYQNTFGNYYDSLITQSGCDSTISTYLTILPLPNISFTGLDSSYCTTDLPVSLTANPAGGSFMGAGMTGNLFDPGSAGLGVHTITYTYTDVNGCTSSTSGNVNIVVCAGILDTDENGKIMIYPNPNSGEFTIELFGMDLDPIIELKITNLLGREVFSERLDQFTGVIIRHIDLSEHGAGVYQLTVTTKTGSTFRKLVVE